MFPPVSHSASPLTESRASAFHPANTSCAIWTERDDELLPFMAEMLTAASVEELLETTRVYWLDNAVGEARRRVNARTPLRRAGVAGLIGSTRQKLGAPKNRARLSIL